MDVEESRILVTGAGGFVGHHLVTFIRSRHHRPNTSQVLTTDSRWPIYATLRDAVVHCCSRIMKRPDSARSIISPLTCGIGFLAIRTFRRGIMATTAESRERRSPSPVKSADHSHGSCSGH